MTRFMPALLLLTLVLGACSSNLPTAETISTVPTIPPPTQPTETPVAEINCGYQWAYEDLPELSAQFDQAVKDLIPDSTSHATIFGENCVSSDGQIIRFLARETDFYVVVTAAALDDYQTFGNWVAGVMQVVLDLPPDSLAGPMPGFVEFRFEKNISEGIGFRVPIQEFMDTADGKTGEELFRLFYTEP